MATYKPASADITHQFLDGEVVAIDFKRGDYYNLRGAAAPAFAALVSGMPAENLPSLFLNAPADAETILSGLVAAWVKAGLLTADASIPSPAAAPEPLAWSEPSFEVFQDMQQLLLADPIHDVGDGAWPRQPESSTSA